VLAKGLTAIETTTDAVIGTRLMRMKLSSEGTVATALLVAIRVGEH
jgi:hypothetical protein